MTESKLKVAIVGGGVAGITAAELLSQKHSVTLFEKNDYVGGHTNTIVLPSGPDAGTAIDTGFIVMNDQTYPLLHRLLKRLGVAWRWSDMSFGYSCAQTGFEYAGTDLNGLFARRRNLLSPAFYRFLFEIRRFCRVALDELGAYNLEGLTLRQFLARHNFHGDVVEYFVVPMGAAIWSSSREGIFHFPAETFIKFFKNHGLLALENRPRWQTVQGGSFSYVKAFLKKFPGTLHKGAAIDSISRGPNGVTLRVTGSEHHFDRVVIATHADEALALLADPSADERRLLGAWSYHQNRTVLHSDASVLSPNRRAWASWNYRREGREIDVHPVNVSYHMNRLQGLRTEREYCVTLNPARDFALGSVIYEASYTHPAFTLEAIASQDALHNLQGVQQTYFAGSYFGYGFHEDAVRSANSLARYFDVPSL